MENTTEQGKTLAIVSYLTIIGTIIAIIQNSENKNTFASFHIRQALGLSLLFMLLGTLVSGFDSWAVTGPFYLFFFALWVYGLIGAIQGRMTLIPFLGPFFQNLFKSL